MATTQLDISLRNPNGRQVESEIIIPVPDGSVFRGFSFEGTNLEATAKILPRDEARRIYDSIVAQTKDPALLEFAGTVVLKDEVPSRIEACRQTRVEVEPYERDRCAQ